MAVDIDKILSKDTADALRRFSGTANKARGNSHPKDFERWNIFVINHHKNGDSLHVDDLGAWLLSDGWSAEKANDLTLKFEAGRALLSQYDAA